MGNILFQHETREAITEKAKSGYAVVVPLAATEQHGPHLPVFTDSIICEHVAQASASLAAKQVSILVTPMIPIGCSEHHLAFGGTISLSSATYLQVLQDIGESLVKCGFTKIIFINGHGGNQALMTQTVSDLATRHSVWTAAGSYWDIASDALQKANASETGNVPGHAGGFETALIMALQSTLVREDRFPISAHPDTPWMGTNPLGTFLGRHGWLTGNNGFTDAPNHVDADTGQRLFEAITEAVAQWLIKSVQIMDAGNQAINR